MAELLTIDEIHIRYPEEYVALVEPELDDQNKHLVRGLVVFHSPIFEEAWPVVDLIRREHPEVICYWATWTFLRPWFDLEEPAR
jgi:hypothetical protein